MIGMKVPPPTPRQEAEAYDRATERDDDRCQRCLTYCGPSTRDHRKDRSVGGETRVSNLQVLGGSGTTGCHGWKTDHPAEANREGWGVPGWADPAEYPARRWVVVGDGIALRWVLYADDGTWREIGEAEAKLRREGRWS